MFSSTESQLRRHGSAQGAWTYEQADALQREHANRLRDDDSTSPLLLISEFAPTITFGKRSPESDFLLGRDQISKNGIDLYAVDRGGLATYHGPGQWVVFYVDRVERVAGDSKKARAAVDFLLERALRVVKRYRKTAEIRSGDALGVWTDAGKVAAVGIRISKGVLLHGVSINGFRTDQSFYGIRPCGLDQPVDFLLKSHDEEAFLKIGEEIRAEFSCRT